MAKSRAPINPPIDPLKDDGEHLRRGRIVQDGVRPSGNDMHCLVARHDIDEILARSRRWCLIGAAVHRQHRNTQLMIPFRSEMFTPLCAVGGELGMGRVGARLEVRDYVTGFKPLVGSGISDTRNDVVYTVALRFNRNRAPQN